MLVRALLSATPRLASGVTGLAGWVEPLSAAATCSGRRANSTAAAAAALEPQSTGGAAIPTDTSLLNLTQTVLPKGSRRTGVIAVKAGMTQEWDEWGQRVPLTVLWIDDCEVVQAKTVEGEGYCSLQLGAGAKKNKQLHFRQVGHYAAAGVGNKRKLAEFRVTPDALMPPKTRVTAAHFIAGQYVDVQGTTIGKGFQGVMKRWGFAGQPASHGNSLAHRAAGSIGGCQDPGKVWPGKKMAGRMGGRTRSLQSAFVFKGSEYLEKARAHDREQSLRLAHEIPRKVQVDPQRNLLYVRGQVPGHKGNFVLVKDAAKKLFEHQPQRPFPTRLDTEPQGIVYAPKPAHNPFLGRDR